MFDKRLIAQGLVAKCIVAGATVALLAACNNKAPEQAGGTASGKVLPGSITDDMLPYDTATSQPPLMAPEPAAAASGTASAAQGETPAAEATATEAAATPAESAPSPAAT